MQYQFSIHVPVQFLWICILFPPNEVWMSSNQSTGQLVKNDLTNWKKALGWFNKHNCFEYHTQSALKFNNFVDLIEDKIQSIDKAIDKGRNKQAEENRNE